MDRINNSFIIILDWYFCYFICFTSFEMVGREEEQITDNKNNEHLEFNSNSESGLYRCRGGIAIFSMHKEEIIDEKNNTSTYEMVCICAECLALTKLSDLRERYNDEDNIQSSGNDSAAASSITISINFKQAEIMAMAVFLIL